MMTAEQLRLKGACNSGPDPGPWERPCQKLLSVLLSQKVVLESAGEVMFDSGTVVSLIVGVIVTLDSWTYYAGG